MAKTINIGIVGCGRVAENHIRAIFSCGNVRLAAVAGGRNAHEFAGKYKVPLLEKEQIAESDLIDALLVLTPYRYHYSYAKQALMHGKHVLVEKPIGFNLAEIQELESIARDTDRVCMPGHSYMYLPEIKRICSSAKQEKIGHLIYFHFSEIYYMPLNLLKKYESPEIDILCHQLYLSLAIAGVPDQVSCFINRFDETLMETGGPQVVVNLKYSGGALGQVVVSWACEDLTSHPWTFTMKVLGDRGGFDFSRRSFSAYDDKGNIEQPLYQEMFDEQMNYFANACIAARKVPLSTMHDAYQVCKIHKAIIDSIKHESIVHIFD